MIDELALQNISLVLANILFRDGDIEDVHKKEISNSNMKIINKDVNNRIYTFLSLFLNNDKEHMDNICRYIENASKFYKGRNWDKAEINQEVYNFFTNESYEVEEENLLPMSKEIFMAKVNELRFLYDSFEERRRKLFREMEIYTKYDLTELASTNSYCTDLFESLLFYTENDEKINIHKIYKDYVDYKPIN